MAEGDSRSKEHNGVILAAIIAGVFGVVTAIVAGIFGLIGKDSAGAGSSTTTHTTTRQLTSSSSISSTTSSVRADCNQQFQVLQPANGTKISASQGVTLEGTACESDLIWVLDYDPMDRSYFQVNNEPLHVLGGKWMQVDKPIGDPADEIGTVYTIVVMKVTPECSDLLKSAPPDEDGTVWFNPLPPGCPTIEDSVNTRSVDVMNAGP